MLNRPSSAAPKQQQQILPLKTAKIAFSVAQRTRAEAPGQTLQGGGKVQRQKRRDEHQGGYGTGPWVRNERNLAPPPHRKARHGAGRFNLWHPLSLLGGV